MANKEVDSFEQIIQSIKSRLPEGSTDEFDGSTIRVVSPRSIPRNILSRGRVYFFRYTFPKTRLKLPYYHMYPCVYATNVEKNYLTGVNLFYLPPKFRSIMLSRFKNKITGEGNFARSLFDYSFMERLKVVHATVKPAIKQYDLRRTSVQGLEISNKLWDEFYMGDLSQVLEKAFIKKNYLNVQVLSRAEIIKNLLNTGGDSDD